jgi:hypothetical protein
MTGGITGIESGTAGILSVSVAAKALAAKSQTKANAPGVSRRAAE